MNKQYKKCLYLTVVLNLTMIQTICFAQDKAVKIDEIVVQYAESGDIHGTVLIAENGTVIYSKAFG